MPAAETFINQLYADDFQKLIPHQQFKNAKGRLQEWLQQQSPPQSLEYQFIQASGPDHNKVYTVAVLIDGKLQAKGSGASKKAAEVAAAEIALQAIEN
jgi:ribonuclease-3